MSNLKLLSKKRKDRLSQQLPIYCLFAPFAILFFVFTLLPILSSVVLSFFFYDTINPPKFVGLDNYIQMFLGDDIFPSALKNTILFAIVTGPFGFILSFLLAWIINEFGKPLRTALSFLFYAPALTGSVYYIWQVIFSGDSFGYLNNLLISMGLIIEPIQWLKDTNYVFTVIAIVQLWMCFGTSFLANIAGLQNVNPELYEAGAIDGIRTRWHELWYITIPSMKNIMLFGAVMQIQAAFSISAVPVALAGFPSVNYSVDTIVTLLSDISSTRHEMGYAAAISVVLFVLMYVTKALMSKLINLSSR